MYDKSFGTIENEKLTIFCYSLERKFKRKNVNRIFVQKYRMLHGNLFSFLLALGMMFFLKSDKIIIDIICVSLLLFSFFYKKIIHKLIIIEKRSFVNFKIDKDQVKDAEILINLFVNNEDRQQ